MESGVGGADMNALLGGSLLLAPVVVGQIFNDVGGFLVGQDFLSLIASLVTSILLSLIGVVLGLPSNGG